MLKIVFEVKSSINDTVSYNILLIYSKKNILMMILSQSIKSSIDLISTPTALYYESVLPLCRQFSE